MCLGFLGLSVVQVIFANGSSTVLKMFPPHQKWLSGCLLLSSGYYSNIGKKERPPSLPPRPPPHHFTAGKSGHRLCHHKSGNCTLQANWLKCSYHVKGGMITKCILQVDIKHGMSKIYIYLDHQIPRHLGRTFLDQKCFKGVVWSVIVHNCTIFLCSLDVRNIVQGGDPLYAVFFSTQGSQGYT